MVITDACENTRHVCLLSINSLNNLSDVIQGEAVTTVISDSGMFSTISV